MLLVCLSLLALNAPSLSEPARWAALLPFCAGVVMEAGFAPAALARLAHGAEHTHRGLAMALYSVAFGAGSLLGNWAGAPFVSWGAMNGITAATALLAALALGVLTVGRRAPGAGAAA
jgi:predicted MFS family arabinose efflux permease